MSVTLSRLVCPSCGAALSAGPGDTLFFCSCGRGVVFSEHGLDAVDAAAFPPPERRAPAWAPAWELVADVTISQRRTTSGSSSAPPPTRRRFLIPARPTALRDVLAQARTWSALPPASAPLPGTAVHGGDLSSEEAAGLARYLVFAEQIAQPDTLAELAVELSVVSVRLVAIP